MKQANTYPALELGCEKKLFRVSVELASID
jgi:hypothetical protein